MELYFSMMKSIYKFSVTQPLRQKLDVTQGHLF